MELTYGLELCGLLPDKCSESNILPRSVNAEHLAVHYQMTPGCRTLPAKCLA